MWKRATQGKGQHYQLHGKGQYKVKLSTLLTVSIKVSGVEQVCDGSVLWVTLPLSYRLMSDVLKKKPVTCVPIAVHIDVISIMTTSGQFMQLDKPSAQLKSI